MDIETESVPRAVESVPPAVVHVATEVPALAHTGADTVAAVPVEVLHDTIRGLTAATEALTTAANRLADTTTKGTEIVTPALEAPLEKAQDIAPEVEPPKPDRFIRRNGRKVKR